MRAFCCDGGSVLHLPRNEREVEAGLAPLSKWNVDED
jgi:hypothetical protein